MRLAGAMRAHATSQDRAGERRLVVEAVKRNMASAIASTTVSSLTGY